MTRPVDHLDEDEIRRRIAAIKVWYHRIEFRPGIITPGVNAGDVTLRHLELPDDCRGLRALDIGARDGYFTFELERRGAEVLALDYTADTDTGFRTAADMFGSKAEFVHANVYDLTPERFGHFDIVMFLGVLYHLPDPLEALHRIRAVSRGRLCMESYVIDAALPLADGAKVSMATTAPPLTDVPLMRFFPGRALNNDPTNYWGPNVACLDAMAREALFRPTSSHLLGSRGIVNAVAVDDAQTAFHNAMSRGVRPRQPGAAL